jgi:hypothetical protein
MRRFLITAALLCSTLSGLAGCKRAAREESRVEPTEEDEAVCEGLVDQCDCKAIETVEGKRACGLSR